MSIFSFGLGATAGFFLAIVVFAGMAAFDVKIDLSIITNIIIAGATVVATLIHFDSQRKQRVDRIWDTNKGILLDLTHELSKTIDATEVEISNSYAQPGEEESSKKHDWAALSEKIEYVLNVYGPLVEEDLRTALNQHKRIRNEISSGVEHEGLDSSDAYEQMLQEHKKLYRNLLSFIAKISGVSVT